MSRQSMEGDNEDDASSATSMKDRSLVWSCFEKIEGATHANRKATCHNCGKVYSAKPSSGIGNLKRHMLKSFNFEEGEPPQKRAPLDQDINSAKKDVIAIYEREKTKLKLMLEKVSSRISFMADLWSSISNDGYMALMAHYADETWVLRKKVLNFRIVPPPHSVQAGLKVIEGCIGKVRESVKDGNENANQSERIDEFDELADFESFPSRFQRAKTSGMSELNLYLEEPKLT
nr:zinc finger BED domain-containing protein RICESLEEPER 2-like [Tanacetum cinerariifolium]